MRQLMLALAVLLVAAPVWAATAPAPTPSSGKQPAATGSAAKPAPTATAPTAAEKAAATAKTAKAVTAAKPKVEFQGASVRQVLDFIAEIGKFGIVYDKALEDNGIDLAAVPISIKVSGLTYEDVLNLVLPRECGYRVEAGYVLVTTLERSWLPLPIHTYDIRMAMAEIPDYGALAPKFNLANIGNVGQGGAGGGGFGGLFTPAAPQPAPAADKVTPDRIINLIKTFVKSDGDRRIAPWSDEGGPATISYLNGFLIVAQTPAGHAAVLRIITMIE